MIVDILNCSVMKKILFFQRVVGDYRVEFFAKLGEKYKVVISSSERPLNDSTSVPRRVDELKLLESGVRYFFDHGVWFETNWLRNIRQENPDLVVISPTPRSLSNYFILIYCKIKKIPVAGWGMGKMPGRSKFLDFVHFAIQCSLVSFLDGMICYSRSAKEYYSKFGLKSLFIAHNAVDISNIRYCDHSRLNDGVLNIAYIGRLDHHKKVDELINIVLSDPGYVLHIVGDGNRHYVDQLKNLANDRVVFYGYQTGSALSEILCLCDISVLPSRGGLAINHAMAAGLPVLASTGDGTEKDLIIDGVTGYVFEDNDWEQLSEKLKFSHKNQEALLRLGRAARNKIVSEYTIEVMVSNFGVACEAIACRKQDEYLK